MPPKREPEPQVSVDPILLEAAENLGAVLAALDLARPDDQSTLHQAKLQIRALGRIMTRSPEEGPVDAGNQAAVQILGKVVLGSEKQLPATYKTPKKAPVRRQKT